MCKVIIYLMCGTMGLVNATENMPRIELSLNGTWDSLPVEWEKKDSLPPVNANWQKIRVPSWWERENKDWTNYDCAWYRKEIPLTEGLKDKQAIIRFNRVNFQCWVYLNGKLAGEHFGGFAPFEIDLTSHFKKNENELLVKVINWSAAVDPSIGFQVSKKEKPEGWQNKQIAPKGWLGYAWGWGGCQQAGICEDVKLILRSKVYIDDVYIKTSFRKQRLDLELTVNNKDERKRKVKLESKVEGTSVFVEKVIELPAFSSKVVNAGCKWENPILWGLNSPHLYKLKTSLLDGNEIIDVKEDRFGFREFWCEGNQFRLNGNKIHLFGANPMGCDMSGYPDDYLATLEKAKANLHKLKGYNANCIRMEHHPFSAYTFQAADETGMLVLDSSPINESITLWEKNSAYWKNTQIQVKERIKAYRNHPSIIIWAAENEKLCAISDSRKFEPQEPAVLAAGEIQDWINEIDPTRPVIFYADADIGGKSEIISFHYPCEYGSWDNNPNLPNAFYWLEEAISKEKGICGYRSWGTLNVLKKPLCITETLFLGDLHPTSMMVGERWRKYPIPRAAQGAIVKMAVEAYRYADIAGIFPYGWLYTEQIPYVKEAFTPQVVFVKEYNKNFFAGRKISRNISIYNDVLKNSVLTLKWHTELEGKVYQQEKFSADFPSGQSLHKDLTLDMPEAKQRSKFEFVLELFDGKDRIFQEQKSYCVFPSNYLESPKDNLKKVKVFDSIWDKWETARALGRLGIDYNRLWGCTRKIDLEKEVPIGEEILVIAPDSWRRFQRNCPAEEMLEYLGEGGRILCLRQEKANFSERFEKELVLSPGEYSMVFSKDGNHEVFTGLKIPQTEDPVGDTFSSDLTFWGEDNIVCNGTFQVPKKEGYKALLEVGGVYSGESPLVEISIGKGKFIICQLELIKKFDEEPIARQILMNLIDCLGKKGGG